MSEALVTQLNTELLYVSFTKFHEQVAFLQIIFLFLVNPLFEDNTSIDLRIWVSFENYHTP